MSGGRRLAVVYDRGAASPGEILASLEAAAELCFVAPPSAHVRQVLPLLREMAPVVEVDADPATAVGAVAPHGIVTFSERRLGFTAELAQGLDLPFHSPALVRLLTDKHAQRRRLRAAGLDSVRQRMLLGPDDWPAALRQVGLPAVLKPVVGGASRNTYKIERPEQGRRLARRLLAGDGGPPEEQALVLEEFLPGRPSLPYGDYVSVESAVRDGSVAHLMVTGKFPQLPPFRETGGFVPPALRPRELAQVLELAGAALRALGVRIGLTHTEIKLTAGGPRILEVNGRLGGLVNGMSMLSSGTDLIELAGRIALGEPELPAPAEPAAGVVFAYNNLPPPEATRLEAASGAAAVRALPEVVRYLPILRPGDGIDNAAATNELDLLLGRAPGHQEMLRIVDQALDRLTFTFTFADGRSQVVPARRAGR